MEKHFILSLPDCLSSEFQREIENNDGENAFKTLKIEKSNDSDFYNVSFKESEYSGVFYELPTVLESHKTDDYKQFYKAADISNCLYVFKKEKKINESEKLNSPQGNKEALDEKNMFEKQEEQIVEHDLPLVDYESLRNRLESSGLSNSLKYVRHRFFKKKSEKQSKLEYRDKKVKELLDRESISDFVEIIYSPKYYLEKPSQDDVSNYISDNNLIKNSENKNEIIKEEIMEKKDMQEFNQIRSDPVKIEVNMHHPEIIELQTLLKTAEEKIIIKKEQLRTVTNKILEKRFTENLLALEEEYQNILNRLNKFKEN